MPESNAEPDVFAAIRQQAATGRIASISPQAQSDLAAHNLRKKDIIDAIIDWIDQCERVKPVVLRVPPAREGQSAYEMKPRINDELWYLKVSFDEPDDPSLGLFLISAHPDHG